MSRLSTVIILLENGYLEYGICRWDNHSFYRRTVDYSSIPWC